MPQSRTRVGVAARRGAGRRVSDVHLHLNVPGGEAVPRDLLLRAAGLTLATEGVSRAELSVTLLGDEEIAELNRRYLAHDWIPDVLSFPLHGPDEPPLGDIYIGLDQARRQAVEVETSLEEELVRLVVHGTLHVLGYDHPEEPEAREESEHYRRQEALVRRLMDEGPENEDHTPTEGSG
jgi:probable rRNA maturation factor